MRAAGEDMTTMKTIAITGGSGRIGHAVAVEALKAGHSVISIDRVKPAAPPDDTRLRFIEADIADYDALVEAFRGADALVHMAAIPSPGRDPDHVIHKNNVVGSYNALRAGVEVGICRIVQASSVNAIGLSFSRAASFDYFPLDEEHPNHNEEPYSLSKWICEQQADSLARRYEHIAIASMRFHYVCEARANAAQHYGKATKEIAKHLWAYTRYDAAASACLLALDAPFKGHEVFYIVAPDTVIDVPSMELAARFFPDVPIREDLPGHTSFFSSKKAERMLGWTNRQG